MTNDHDTIGSCIDARSRDLYYLLSDAVAGAPRWRPRALRLLADIKTEVLGVDNAIAQHKSTEGAE